MASADFGWVGRLARELGIVVSPRGASERSFWAICPFHGDKHPSLQVDHRAKRPWLDEVAGDWRCRACGERGSVYDLVRRLHATRPDFAAAKELVEALRSGESIEAEPPPDAIVLEQSSARPFELPAGVRVEPLESWPGLARRYLERRGVPAWQVARWGVGYAAQGRLAGRVVIPVRDAAGRPRTYMARSFTGDEPKYLTPRMAERPDLGALFGVLGWEEASHDVVYAAEGAFNALAFERAFERAFDAQGCDHVAVAALGGASDLQAAHVALLSQFRLVVLASDHDAAGDRAAERLAFALGRHARVARLELPRDADEMEPAELRARALDVALPERSGSERVDLGLGGGR